MSPAKKPPSLTPLHTEHQRESEAGAPKDHVVVKRREGNETHGENLVAATDKNNLVGYSCKGPT